MVSYPLEPAAGEFFGKLLLQAHFRPIPGRGGLLSHLRPSGGTRFPGELEGCSTIQGVARGTPCTPLPQSPPMWHPSPTPLSHKVHLCGTSKNPPMIFWNEFLLEVGLPACEECWLRDDQITHAYRPKADRRRSGGEVPWTNFLIFNLLERNLQ